MKTTIKVTGMTCGHCEAAVKGALESLSGVTDVNVDLDTGKVDITYDDLKVTVDKMNEAIEDQGYDVV